MKRQLINTLIIGAVSMLITGCASGYSKYYKPVHNDKKADLLKNPNLEFLKNGEEPIVYGVSKANIDKEIQKLKSKRYLPLGYSSFNGKLEERDEIVDTAKDLGAKLAIYTWQYTDTRTSSGVLALPKTNYSNTYMSGNVGGTSYSGTAYTRSTGTSYTPYSFSTRRYDQTAYFFIKSKYPYNFGTASSTMISRDERIKIGQNGVKVNVIIEDTPAYNSDLLVGDIILSINSNKIENYKTFKNLADECIDIKGICELEVYRDYTRKIVRVNF